MDSRRDKRVGGTHVDQEPSDELKKLWWRSDAQAYSLWSAGGMHCRHVAGNYIRSRLAVDGFIGLACMGVGGGIMGCNGAR